MNKDENSMKNQLIIGSVCVAILIVALITYLVYSNSGPEEFEGEEFSSINDVNYTYNEETENIENSESASTEMGKTVEEAENDLEENTVTENKVTTTKKTTSTSTSANTTKNKKEENTSKENEEDKKEKETKKEEEPKFVSPLKGEVMREYSSDTLVYSNTLEEWIAHNGIDIKADQGAEVKSASEGTVYAIKNDPRYGLTVIVNHSAGYQTVYSNLLTAEFVVEGEKVQAGQTIGTVGNTASFEISDDYHLHFEVLKNNKNINPTDCIEF